ncbi:ribosome maturation factor RimP [[Clostridium] fimetarium]|uniref:Ribosome maturation factor RimP n=1 Tax=[Clostridium] fimetarium TaxID=99656 RepID=A0A1I0N4G8_9FIRM|nr:ribosome maturation factor RimP [[Clostridium] fimetarium]SEV95523.1 ribosome maturation factor RimP [[Clostridium] fimetarium]
MTKKEIYENKTETLITPLIKANNFELVDVEYVKEGSTSYLRVYIDKEDGITVEDCTLLSRAFNLILDTNDYIDDTYIFEVSSPGLMRPLKKDKDFQRNLGKQVEIRLFKSLDKQKEFEGELKSFDKDNITVMMEDEKEIIFKRIDIALVRLAFDF